MTLVNSGNCFEDVFCYPLSGTLHLKLYSTLFGHMVEPDPLFRRQLIGLTHMMYSEIGAFD